MKVCLLQNQQGRHFHPLRWERSPFQAHKIEIRWVSWFAFASHHFFRERELYRCSIHLENGSEYHGGKRDSAY